MSCSIIFAPFYIYWPIRNKFLTQVLYLAFQQYTMRIKIEAYNSQWAIDYLNEEQKIIRALDNLYLTIDHIGSTSVPGLGAKPIIDILIGLKDESYLDKVINPMVNCGYTYFKKYEPDMPYRRLFVKLEPLTDLPPPHIIGVNDEYISGQFFIPLTNIHVIVKDTYHWTRHIAFRDFLRAHPEMKDKYFQLKQNLSEQEFSHHLEYNAAKNNFVKETEQLALHWFQKKNNRLRNDEL